MSDVLRADVTGMQVTQIGQGIGIMGDIYRADLAYANDDGAGPASVVIKLPSSALENRERGIAFGMFEAEVRFYRELAGQVSAGLPEVYLAEIESGTADFVIVMEDLSDLSLVEQSAGMSLEQAQAAMRATAGIHVTWWNRADGPDLEWLPTTVGDRIKFVDPLLVEILPQFLASFGDQLPDGAPNSTRRSRATT